jgi:hypothetical protein
MGHCARVSAPHTPPPRGPPPQVSECIDELAAGLWADLLADTASLVVELDGLAAS